MDQHRRHAEVLAIRDMTFEIQRKLFDTLGNSSGDNERHGGPPTSLSCSSDSDNSFHLSNSENSFHLSDFLSSSSSMSSFQTNDLNDNDWDYSHPGDEDASACGSEWDTQSMGLSPMSCPAATNSEEPSKHDALCLYYESIIGPAGMALLRADGNNCNENGDNNDKNVCGSTTAITTMAGYEKTKGATPFPTTTNNLAHTEWATKKCNTGAALHENALAFDIAAHKLGLDIMSLYEPV